MRDPLDALERDGYAVLPDFLGACYADIRAGVLELVGDASPTGTVHVDLEPVADDLLAPVVTHRLLQEATAHVLRGPARRTGLHYRGPNPGFGAQTLHADWTHAAPDGDYRVLTAILALCDFTAEVGPTRVVPGSHRDWSRFAAKDPSSRHPGERLLLGPAGTCFVLNGHLLHSGTRNQSPSVRHALLVNLIKVGP